MKKALAILFSMALVWTQSVAALNLVIAKNCPPQKHCCCGPNQSCCAAKSQSDSQPAVPAPANTSTQLQLALPLSRPVLNLADFVSAKLSFSIPPVLPVSAVSLYQRNCAYLI